MENTTDYNNPNKDVLLPTYYEKFILFDDRPFYLPLMATIYLLQFLVCIIGNCLLLYILPRVKKPEDYISYALCALACSDILIAFTLMPRNFLYETYIDWFLGRFLCKFIIYLSTVNNCSNIWLTVYIAFDRYINICHPFKFFQLKTKKFCIIMICIIFCVHAVILCYGVIFTRIDYFTDCNCDLCYLDLPNKYIFMHIIAVNLIYSYALPVMLLLLFYGSIIKSLLKFMSFTNLLTNSKIEYHNNIPLSDLLFVKIVLFIIGFFIFSNFLLFVVRMWHYFFTLTITSSSLLEPGDGFREMSSIALYLQTIHGCCNPWTYCFYSKKFLSELKKIINCENSILFYSRSTTIQDSSRILGNSKNKFTKFDKDDDRFELD